jgi:hypothetical protein
MAIKNGGNCVSSLYEYYVHNDIIHKNDILDILLTMIEGNIKFSSQRNGCKWIFDCFLINTYLFTVDTTYYFIISMCQIIDNINLCSEDFEYYSAKIIDFIQTNKIGGYFFERCISEQEMDNINHFIKHIGIVYYRNNKNNNNEYIHTLFKEKTSQLFMEYLDHHYYKYLEKKYSPDPPGPGYIKTKKHFESIVTKTKR